MSWLVEQVQPTLGEGQNQISDIAVLPRTALSNCNLNINLFQSRIWSTFPTGQVLAVAWLDC